MPSGIVLPRLPPAPKAWTRVTVAAGQPIFPILYGRDTLTMQPWELYIREPRSAQEIDHLCVELALLIVNAEGILPRYGIWPRLLLHWRISTRF